MRFKLITVSLMTLIMLGLSLLAGHDAAAQVPRINKEELKGMLGRPDVIIIDVRQPGQWDESKVKILGAHREDPTKKIESWAAKYPENKTIVLY